jgi:hypothetical protein
MRRALLVASVVSVFVIACSSEERAKPIQSNPVDTGIVITEAGNNDTGTAPNDTGGDADMPDTTVPDSGVDATVDTNKPMDDAIVISDIMSTRDTQIDAVMLEAGGGDTRPDTELPDVSTLSDSRIDVDPDSPSPF